MARISFFVLRNNYYKTIGGLIEESLKRGHQVNLLIDASSAGEVVKGMLCPDENSVPCFRNGVPSVVKYGGIRQLSEVACKCSDIVAVHNGAFSEYEKQMSNLDTLGCQLQKIRQASVPVISLQSHFYDNCLLSLDAYDSVDKTLLLSKDSVEKHKEILLELSKDTLREKDGSLKQRIDEVFALKTVVTGSPLFEFFDRVYKERETSSNDRGDFVYFVPKIDHHPFMQVIMREHPRWVSYLRSCYWYKGRYRKLIWEMPRVKEFLNILKVKVSDKGFRMLSKSRVKHGNYLNRNLEELSYRYYTGEDDEYYPNFTSARVFENAKFSIHMRTFSVMEAVLSGVPAVNIRVPIIEQDDIARDLERIYVQKVRGNQPDTLFNFSGCVTSISWEESLEFFAQQDFQNMQQDPERREHYVQNFCGVDKARTASEKQCDEIEKML
jgi:hypothetical protein